MNWPNCDDQTSPLENLPFQYGGLSGVPHWAYEFPMSERESPKIMISEYELGSDLVKELNEKYNIYNWDNKDVKIEDFLDINGKL